MKLNHDIYREAMENVKMPDEVGRKLLENAAQQNRQRRKRRKTQMAAAIAGILLITLGVNGITYAQTGKNVLQMFTALFENINANTQLEEITSLAEHMQESGESITNENIRFTLEYYFYDQKNKEAFTAIRMDSLDGKPINAKKTLELYTVDMRGDLCGCYGNWSDPTYNKDKTSARFYSRYTMDEFETGELPEQVTLEFEYWDYKSDEIGENGELDVDIKKIGSFTLKATGTMKTRLIDCSSLGYQFEKAWITGSGVSIRFQEDIKNTAYTDQAPIQIMDIEMSDGTIYRCGRRRYQTIPIYDANGKLKNKEAFTPEEVEVLDKYVIPEHQVNDSLPSNVRMLGDFSCNTNNWQAYTEFSTTFADYFIDVDDIVSVEINGVEMPLE